MVVKAADKITIFICSLLVIALIFISQYKTAPNTGNPDTDGLNIGPDIQFLVGNETYSVNETMGFSSITIASSYIIFNSTGFFVTSDNDITITLVDLRDSMYGVSDGVKVLEFYAGTTGNVWFSLSGFPVGNDYIVNRGGITIASPAANSSGFISFPNDVWSTQLFEIFQDTPWDIDQNGVINILDLVLVSNHYGETGDPGWIREDVDNNGEVKVFDLILVSNHYGET